MRSGWLDIGQSSFYLGLGLVLNFYLFYFYVPSKSQRQQEHKKEQGHYPAILIKPVSSIRHLHTSHNTPCLPPKVWHKYCLQFPLGPLKYPGGIKNQGYAKIRGQTRCIL